MYAAVPSFPYTVSSDGVELVVAGPTTLTLPVFGLVTVKSTPAEDVQTPSVVPSSNPSPTSAPAVITPGPTEHSPALQSPTSPTSTLIPETSRPKTTFIESTSAITSPAQTTDSSSTSSLEVMTPSGTTMTPRNSSESTRITPTGVQQDLDNRHLSNALIIGLGVAGLLVFIGIIVGIIFFLRHRKANIKRKKFLIEPNFDILRAQLEASRGLGSKERQLLLRETENSSESPSEATPAEQENTTALRRVFEDRALEGQLLQFLRDRMDPPGSNGNEIVGNHSPELRAGDGWSPQIRGYSGGQGPESGSGDRGNPDWLDDPADPISPPPYCSPPPQSPLFLSAIAI